MDPLTIGLLAASVGGQLFSHIGASNAASENLDYQRARDAEMMRMAQASRVDPYGNRTYYDPSTNSWKIDMTPQQQKITMAGEREQLLQLLVDAARSREARGRQARAGEMAQPAFDTALAGMQFDRGPTEEATRAQLTRLLTASKAYPFGSTSATNLRTYGNVPLVNYGIPVPSGSAQLADTLLQARPQALQETTARQSALSNKYGPAIDRYLGIMGGGGGTNTGINTQSGAVSSFANQESDMAHLLASVGAQGAQNVGNAETAYSKALAGLAPDTRGNAALITALGKYSNKSNPTDVGSAISYSDNPNLDELMYSDPYFARA